jgi:hypothetical protein
MVHSCPYSGVTKVYCTCPSTCPVSYRLSELLRPRSHTREMLGRGTVPALIGSKVTLSSTVPRAGTYTQPYNNVNYLSTQT